MKFQALRIQKSHWLMWTCYFIAFFTLLGFAVIFASFLLQGLVILLSEAAATPLPAILFETFKIFFWAYLWTVPWAALVTIYCWRNRGLWLSRFVSRVVKSYLRVPMTCAGVMIIYLFQDLSADKIFCLLVGLLALPRFIHGWSYTLVTAPSGEWDAGLALGMTPWQIFTRVYWPIYWVTFTEHFLKVTAVIFGAVAPFVYLTTFSFLADRSAKFISLEAFKELVKGNDSSVFVWVAITAISLIIINLTILDEQPVEERHLYG